MANLGGFQGLRTSRVNFGSTGTWQSVLSYEDGGQDMVGVYGVEHIKFQTLNFYSKQKQTYFDHATR